jgi:hypothetical protein
MLLPAGNEPAEKLTVRICPDMAALPAAPDGVVKVSEVPAVQASPLPEIVNSSLPVGGIVTAGCKLMCIVTSVNAFITWLKLINGYREKTLKLGGMVGRLGASADVDMLKPGPTVCTIPLSNSPAATAKA